MDAGHIRVCRSWGGPLKESKLRPAPSAGTCPQPARRLGASTDDSLTGPPATSAQPQTGDSRHDDTGRTCLDCIKRRRAPAETTGRRGVSGAAAVTGAMPGLLTCAHPGCGPLSLPIPSMKDSQHCHRRPRTEPDRPSHGAPAGYA
jgi:hypothetical protein